jgi:hypothetical protein
MAGKQPAWGFAGDVRLYRQSLRQGCARTRAAVARVVEYGRERGSRAVGDNKGQLWPLQLIFLVAGGLGLIVMVAPNLFGPTDRSGLALPLFLIAGVAALLLYLPHLWVWLWTPNLTGIANGVTAIQGQLPPNNEPPVRQRLANLATGVAAIQDQLLPAGQPTVRQQVLTISTAATAIQNELPNIRDAVAAIRQQLPDAANGQPPIRDQLNQIQTRLTAIEQRLPPRPAGT